MVLTAEFGLVGAASVTTGLTYSTRVMMVHHQMYRAGVAAGERARP
ncbi:MAG: hypothetical protein L0H64_12705 [Pseudonocardia sp.]|nr:hypothetical protein [Pseudonocardia sp.]